MPNKDKFIKKNVCDVCGTEIGAVANKTGCPICEDIYFGKIKESYNKNLQRLDIVSKDLFKLYFDLSEESVKASYKIIKPYLEIEKNLRIYNPSWYYFFTSCQLIRNKVLDNAMQNASTLYSNFTDVWKANLSIISENIASTLENMNRFCNTCNETMHIEEKIHLSRGDRNLVRTINKVDNTYNTYQKEERAVQISNSSDNIIGVLKKE